MTRTDFLGYGSLFIIFLISLAVLLPAKTDYRFSVDDHEHLKIATRMSSAPLAVFDIETKDKRRHPAYYCLLFAEKHFFEDNIPPYFLIHYLLHLLNSFLLIRLALRLGSPPFAAFLSGILFFASSAFYHIMIKLTGTLELLGLFFFLLAALSWLKYLRGCRYASLEAAFFMLASLLSYEVAIVFPALAAALTWIFVSDPRKRNQILIRSVLPLAIIVLSLFFLLTKDFWHSSSISEKIAFQSPQLLLLKVATFTRMFLYPVFRQEGSQVPSYILDNSLLRLFPFIIILLSAVIFFRKSGNFFPAVIKAAPLPLFATGILWVSITIFPHFPYPSHFFRATRYLLFPAVGVALLLGFFLSRFFFLILEAHPRTGLFLCGFILAYYVAINLWSVSFQYNRFHHYLAEHPNDDETGKVIKLFRANNTQRGHVAYRGLS